MSTCAPVNGWQPPVLSRETSSVRVNGVPGLTRPSVGSERMSDRFKRSSTKYGPSVCSGRTTQEGPGESAMARHGVSPPASQSTPVAPSNVTTSRRERRRPRGVSSGVIGVLAFCSAGVAGLRLGGGEPYSLHHEHRCPIIIALEPLIHHHIVRAKLDVLGHALTMRSGQRLTRSRAVSSSYTCWRCPTAITRPLRSTA